MSHEVLVLSGGGGTEAERSRRRLLASAVRQVPGAVRWQTYEDPRTVVALVETVPGGGSAASIEPLQGGGVEVVVAMSSDALSSVRAGSAGAHSGADQGHVRVAVRPDGDVVASTDGTGIIPAFWAGVGPGVALSTHLPSLVSLGVPGDLDEVGSLEYLVMLQPLGARTVLAGANLIPAGGTLRVGAGRPASVSVQRLYAPTSPGLSDSAAVGEFAALWADLTADLVGRASGQRLALGLSGGLDSRAIAVECVRQGAAPHAFTYGAADSRPARVASQVARRLDLDHTMLALRESRLMPDPSSSAALLDGAHSPAEMYELWFAPDLRQFADVVVNGHGGGPLWGDEKALGIQDQTLLRDALERRFASELAAVTPFLSDAVAQGAAETFRASLGESLGEWDARERGDMVSFWNVHNRQFRWGNMLATALRRNGLRLEAPFMDARFLRFSAALTPEQRRNGRLYLRVHREVFGETAHLPRSDDGNPPDRLSHLYWSGESSFARQFAELARQHPASAARRAARRAQGNLAHRLEGSARWSAPAEQHLERHSVFVADAWVRNVEGYRRRLREFLGGSPTPSIVSSEAVARAVDGLSSGSVRSGALRLARVATLQAWSREFARRATECASTR